VGNVGSAGSPLGKGGGGGRHVRIGRGVGSALGTGGKKRPPSKPGRPSRAWLVVDSVPSGDPLHAAARRHAMTPLPITIATSQAIFRRIGISSTKDMRALFACVVMLFVSTLRVPL
jgi:hypothetical protein